MDKKAIFAGIFAAVSWGTVFVFGQVAVQAGFHPVLVAFFRFASANVFLFFYHLMVSGRFFLDRRDILNFILLGATGIFGMNLFIFYSLRLTDSTITSLLMNANGFIIGILGFLMLREKTGILELLGLVVGISGCWLIFTQGELSRISHSNLLGNIFALCASFCWAFYSVWGKKTKVIEKYGAILSTFWASMAGSIMLGLTILLTGIPLFLDARNVLISVYLGIVPAGIGFTLWFYSISRLKTVIPGIIQFLAPLTTALLAILILNQRINLATILGGILIMAGVLFSLKNQPR
ncbi:MAG: EamA family transporter [Candidatus Omnitrophica bacterium]|nr:EamA family transporter [Candidatus Omnitrophota bacterium]